MIIALPCAAGLYVLAVQICDLLYHAPEAGIPLAPLAFSTIMLAAFQLSSAGLQGIGRPEIGMRNLIITGALKVVFNYTLTAVPALNIQGAAIGTIMAFFIGALLNLIALQRLTGIHYEVGRLIKLGGLTVLMGLVVKLSYSLIVVEVGLSSHLTTVMAILIGMIVYGVGLLLLKEFDIEMVKKLIA
jgi:stage V sporulation protein B